MLFVIEDAHWIDPSTLEATNRFIEAVKTAAVLLLITFRPEFFPPWLDQPHVTMIQLNRLGRDQASAMIRDLAGGKELPAEVLEQILNKTDGVPLFIEELTKMVLESGLLQERAERYELTGRLPALAIPTTLHDSLMARLDRLAAVKTMTQLGATLGESFLMSCCKPSPSGTRAPCNKACTSWWRRNSCTSVVCRRRPRTSSSMR